MKNLAIKYLPFVLLIFITNTIYSQQTLNAVVLKKGSNDSLHIEMLVEKYYNDMINELSFYKKIRVISDKDKYWIRPKDIDCLVFIDFLNKRRVFVTQNFDKELNKIDVKNIRLFEKLYEGEISWYIEYYPHGYDRSRMSQNHFIKKNYLKPATVHMLTTNKRQLLKITKDRPDLVHQINQLKTDEDILEILKSYNNKTNVDKM